MAATHGTNGALVVPPADNRIQSGSVNIPPAELPETAFPASFDPKQVAVEFTETLNRRLDGRDYHGIANLFAETGCWRDHLALSWDLRSLEGPAKIQKYLASHGENLQKIAIEDSKPYFAPGVSPLDAEGRSQCVAFAIGIVTKVGTGQGIVRLIYVDGQWKAFGVYTALQELTGFEEPCGPRRPMGHEHRGDNGTKNWQEARVSDANFEASEPAVLIIGTVPPPFPAAWQTGLTPPLNQAPGRAAWRRLRGSRCSTSRRSLSTGRPAWGTTGARGTAS